MSRAWCAAFMNMVLRQTGHTGSGSNLARSFASYGRRVSGLAQIGAIAVMSRRGGGHVGVVSSIDATGNPIVISGITAGALQSRPDRAAASTLRDAVVARTAGAFPSGCADRHEMARLDGEARNC